MTEWYAAAGAPRNAGPWGSGPAACRRIGLEIDADLDTVLARCARVPDVAEILDACDVALVGEIGAREIRIPVAHLEAQTRIEQRARVEPRRRIHDQGAALLRLAREVDARRDLHAAAGLELVRCADIERHLRRERRFAARNRDDIVGRRQERADDVRERAE